MNRLQRLPTAINLKNLARAGASLLMANSELRHSSSWPAEPSGSAPNAERRQ